MKPRNTRILITAASVLMLVSSANAADGIWNVTTTPASWDADTNWLASTIADGFGFIADFSTLDIIADTIVTLDSDRTIGSLFFGDTDTGSAAGWILAGAGDPAGNLTLAGNPTITVSALGTGKSATISATLVGIDGFTKNGDGTLVLSNDTNTLSGPVVLAAGTLQLDTALALQNCSLNTTASIAGTATAGIVLNGVTSPAFGGLTGNKPLASLFNTETGNHGLVTNVTLSPAAGPNLTYAGAIANGADGMTLTKSGPGVQILSVANSYTGGTIMHQGVLIYAHPSALSSGPISFTGNATLRPGINNSTLANPVSVNAGVNATFGNNGFAATISGAITGDGSFAKQGIGFLTLTGGLANTFSGGFNILQNRVNVTDGLSLTNATGPITVASGACLNYSKNFELGNNLTNAITISGTGVGTFGALNLQGNVDVTGSITLADDATISHNFNNATISGPINGSNHNLTLTTISTATPQPGMTVSGPISLGTGGITVQGVANLGDFSIKLSGNNSYTGETHIVSGTLMLSGDARIHDSSTVRIDSGAVLHLISEGADRVAALILGGVAMPPGTYGSPTSSATNKSADFAGNGILEVVAPTDGYDSWAAANGIRGQPFDGDFNRDGIINGVAYALGLSPTESSHPAGVLAGSTITFTKGAEAIANADVSWIIQTSETLDADSWTDAVTQVAGDPTATISYNLAPAPGTPKKFARLKAVRVP